MDSCNESCLKSTGWKLRKRHLDGFPTFLQNRPACWILGDPKFWTLLGGDCCWWWWQCRSKNDTRRRLLMTGMESLVAYKGSWSSLNATIIDFLPGLSLIMIKRQFILLHFCWGWHRVPNMDWSVPSASSKVFASEILEITTATGHGSLLLVFIVIRSTNRSIDVILWWSTSYDMSLMVCSKPHLLPPLLSLMMFSCWFAVCQ